LVIYNPEILKTTRPRGGKILKEGNRKKTEVSQETESLQERCKGGVGKSYKQKKPCKTAETGV